MEFKLRREPYYIRQMVKEGERQARMRELKRWNYARHEYEPYMVPEEWKVSLYENDMETIVNCAHCGEEYTFGEMYTSMEIHNQMGFGYGVCEKCYQQEMNRRVAE